MSVFIATHFSLLYVVLKSEMKLTRLLGVVRGGISFWHQLFSLNVMLLIEKLFQVDTGIVALPSLDLHLPRTTARRCIKR